MVHFGVADEFLHLQACQLVYSFDQAVEDEDHDGHAGDQDDDVAPEGHFSHFLGEGFCPGLGLDEDFGQDKVEDGGEEEGEGEEVGAVDQEFVEGGSVAAFMEDGVHFVSLHDLIIVDEESYQRFVGGEGDDYGDAKEGRDGGFFPGNPFFGHFEEGHEPGEQYAAKAENGEEVVFFSCEKIVDSVADRKE